jgi:hypothetical protein
VVVVAGAAGIIPVLQGLAHVVAVEVVVLEDFYQVMPMSVPAPLTPSL